MNSHLFRLATEVGDIDLLLDPQRHLQVGVVKQPFLKEHLVMSLDSHHGLPRYLTNHIGSENDGAEGRLFCLWKDGEMLTVQSPIYIPPGYRQYGEDHEADKIIMSDFDFDLEKIQTLVSSLIFGRTNWAYLVTRENGSYSLVYKNKPVYNVTCPPWAPLVDEKDIIITRWISAEDRHGIWNGREVDLFMGWNNRWAQFIDYEMQGHRFLRGLDLTFEVLGHVVNSDGKIIGLMTEAAYGRMVEYRDRVDVYDAITKLQSKGFRYTLHSSSIMISGGKVRLLYLSSVKRFETDAKGLADVEYRHWTMLERLFEDLRKEPNFLIPMRYWNPSTKVLPFIPSPERPIPDFSTRLASLIVQFANPLYKHWEESTKSSSDPQHSRIILRGRQTRGVVLAGTFSVDQSDSTVDEASDMPGGLVVYRSHHKRLLNYDPFHPSSRHSKPKKLIISYDNSDQSSESGCSSIV